MHVFCPDCNAEYKVNERSSLTKTVKFVCVECGSSWVDKFEKLEKTKSIATDSVASKSDDETRSTNTESGKMELNSLALEEVQNSFGNLKNRIDSKYENTEADHIFEFETIEESNESGDEGPSKTFPKIRSNQESPANEEIEERDVKEIEIERRLKESSELLKKAKQPNLENKETVPKENKPKRRKLLVTLSIVIIISFFTYNLTNLFLEDILREVPFAPEILSQISLYTAVFKDIILITIEKILNFIPNLA
jgi:Zn-finger nucleic acid-binding protein